MRRAEKRSTHPDFDELHERCTRIVAMSRNGNLDPLERQRLKRMREQSPYSSVIVVLCMDERCRSFVEETGAMTGYYRFMHTKGARITLSNFQVANTIGKVLKTGNTEKPVLIIFTVHFSGKFPHLSCAGWDCKTKKAFEHQARVAEALRRNYPEQIHTVIVGFDTDTMALQIPTDDDSCNAARIIRARTYEEALAFDVDSMLASALHHTSGQEFVHTSDTAQRECARTQVLLECRRMFRANALRVWQHLRDVDGALCETGEWEIDHSATMLFAGTGFEFWTEHGSAVYVGLHSSTFIEDVALGVEKIILPNAREKEEQALIVVNRKYNPDLEGDRAQAMDWAHAVVEDLACLFREQLDAKELRIMESVSTIADGMMPILTI